MEKLKKPFAHIIERFAKQKNEIHRLWNVGEETAELLSFLVMLKKPKIILELGTSNGYSTFHLALCEKATIYTIDVETARNKLAKENLKDFPNIVFITDRIDNYIPTIDYKIDMLFIDCNKSNYLRYLTMCEPYLSNEALVVADNIDSHSTTGSFREYVSGCDKYTAIHLSIDDGVVVAIYNGEKQRV